MDRVSLDVGNIIHYCLSTGNSEIALRFILLNTINTLMYIFVSYSYLPSNTFFSTFLFLFSHKMLVLLAGNKKGL